MNSNISNIKQNSPILAPTARKTVHQRKMERYAEKQNKLIMQTIVGSTESNPRAVKRREQRIKEIEVLDYLYERSRRKQRRLSWRLKKAQAKAMEKAMQDYEEKRLVGAKMCSLCLRDDLNPELTVVCNTFSCKTYLCVPCYLSNLAFGDVKGCLLCKNKNHPSLGVKVVDHPYALSPVEVWEEVREEVQGMLINSREKFCALDEPKFMDLPLWEVRGLWGFLSLTWTSSEAKHYCGVVTVGSTSEMIVVRNHTRTGYFPIPVYPTLNSFQSTIAHYKLTLSHLNGRWCLSLRFDRNPNFLISEGNMFLYDLHEYISFESASEQLALADDELSKRFVDLKSASGQTLELDLWAINPHKVWQIVGPFSKGFHRK